MNQPIELSLEQEFSLRSFADQVHQMSREQAQEFLLVLHKQMMTHHSRMKNEKKYLYLLRAIPIHQ